MKGEAEKIYAKLRDDLIRTHGEWATFRALYTRNKDRYELLNATAPSFFGMTQRLLIDRAALSLSRFTDPARLESLPRLVELLESQVHHTFAEQLRGDLDALELACSDIRDHRDKRIAHRARTAGPPQINETAQPLPPLSIKKIEDAMRRTADLMNKILGYFQDAEQHYEPVVRGGADALLFYLQKGLDAARQEDTNLKSQATKSQSA
jgi:hypothetical protein